MALYCPIKRPASFPRNKDSGKFPTSYQMVILKKIMDGDTVANISETQEITPQTVRNQISNAIRRIGVSNMYELIVWGLKNNIIKDDPIEIDFKSVKTKIFEPYPRWLQVLNLFITGRDLKEVSEETGLSKSSIEFFQDFVIKQFNLHPSMASYLRFGLASLNCITPSMKIYGSKPFKAWESPYATIQFPPMISSYRPVKRDPTIPILDQTVKWDMKDFVDNDDAEMKTKLKKSLKLPAKVIEVNRRRVIVRSTSIQTALYLIGLDKKMFSMSKTRKQCSFWGLPPAQLWDILELAGKIYEYERKYSHPDRGGDSRRAAQINAAWRLVKKLFARRGFELHSKST